MTRMLVGVTGNEEAEIALAAGADILHLMPGISANTCVADLRQFVDFIAGRGDTSACAGGASVDPHPVRAEIADVGIDRMLIALPPGGDLAGLARAVASVAPRTSTIALILVDRPPDLDVLPLLAGHGFHGIMLGTAGTEKPRLLDRLPAERIAAVISRARSLGLEVGLSGLLEAPDVARLLPLRPDVLGFRTALLSTSGPVPSLDAVRVAQFRALIPSESRTRRTVARTDDAGDSAAAPPEYLAERRDRVFVRDFVLPVELGAYSFERGRSQRVRFDVTAEVLRPAGSPQDMRHVFSYDIIMDGIRAVVAEGHTELVETLAERVASIVLADTRVVEVTVRVEKLDLGAGGVGVEIGRARPRR